MKKLLKVVYRLYRLNRKQAKEIQSLRSKNDFLRTRLLNSYMEQKNMEDSINGMIEAGLVAGNSAAVFNQEVRHDYT